MVCAVDTVLVCPRPIVVENSISVTISVPLKETEIKYISKDVIQDTKTHGKEKKWKGKEVKSKLKQIDTIKKWSERKGNKEKQPKFCFAEQVKIWV